MMRRQNQDHQSRVFDELSALVFSLLRSSTPISFSEQIPLPATPVRRRLPKITPAGFASLLLGMSLSLMLCGSVTFFIGFLLMPWVLGLVMVFYVAGIVSTISMLGRSLLCHATAPPSSTRKEVPGIFAGIFGFSFSFSLSIYFLCKAVIGEEKGMETFVNAMGFRELNCNHMHALALDRRDKSKGIRLKLLSTVCGVSPTEIESLHRINTDEILIASRSSLFHGSFRTTRIFFSCFNLSRNRPALPHSLSSLNDRPSWSSICP
ncbi:hypothetical protein SADUNF_Sadunf01G0044400 [Salix dunnii]|uniref:Uncharacterized protein n=1 Tax=Salix dunnii TaxID=1413687 RepID=A0A835TJ57_9ROSI|nr:hypothetical protein SADUNF_Sadunf01G0044400 [Salix dunnii]